MSSIFHDLRFMFRGALLPLLLVNAFSSAALASSVRITSYGHSSLLIKGGGKSVLLNPFKAVACAQGLREPRIRANIILASSDLADEGAKIAKGIFFSKPGSYRVNGLKLEGFSVPHDRFGGRRYGYATYWKWRQAGLNFAHLGSGVAPLTGEDKVLLGKPDVLIIGVGGGAKVYNGNEAAKVVNELKPKRVIPVHYVRGTAPKNCDQTGVQPFLDAMDDTEVRKVGKNLFLGSNLSDKTIVNVMH